MVKFSVVVDKAMGQIMWDDLQENKRLMPLIVQTTEEDKLNSSFLKSVVESKKRIKMLSDIAAAFSEEVIWEFRDSERPEKDLNISMRVE